MSGELIARTFVSVPEILSNWCSANTVPLRGDDSGEVKEGRKSSGWNEGAGTSCRSSGYDIDTEKGPALFQQLIR